MKNLLAGAAVATVALCGAASAATLDFLSFANNNEHGVANGTVINFDGVDVEFNAGLHNGDNAFSYFDHGGAGLGVCKFGNFGGGQTNAGTGNTCLNASGGGAAGDDNVTVSEVVTISFNTAYNLSDLSFTGEGHSFSNPVFLQDETTGLNRSAKTLLFGINGGALTEYTFSELAALSFGSVLSATFAFDDSNESTTADQFYLASAVVNPIPLPAGLPLLLAGIGGLGLMRRRQRKAA